MNKKFSQIFFVVTFILFLAGAIWFLQPVDIAWAGINDDLVSYWKYDEGEDDTCVGSEDICDSQGDNHGERAGAGGTNNKPQWSSSQKPTLAAANPYALDFDGSDDEVTGIGDINFSGNAFSVSTWVYPDNWGASGDSYIHNILCDEAPPGGDVTNTTMCFRIGSLGQDALKQKIALMIHDDSNSNDFESTTNLALDTWTHVAVTWDGSDVKFYINGSLDRTQSDPTLVMNDGTLGFRMGSSPSASRYFDGGLDELRLYDRALTAPEINELATINPGVSTLSPIDGATGVGVNDNLVITFDKDMQAVTEKNVYIKKLSNDSIVETIAADDAKITISGAIVTINPDTTLDEKTDYYLNIDSGAFEDLSSNDYSGMSGNESWNFTTEDTVSPTASTLSPADDATGVAVDANLIITFDEVVDAESGNITLYKSDDTEIEVFDVTSDISGSGSTTITINPASDLASETSYYVQIDATAFDDSSSNSYTGIADETSWTFTTADVAGPIVSNLSPADDATGVAVDANLIITFDEAVDAESGNITLYKSDDTEIEVFDVTTDISGSGSTTITIDLADDLDYETSYYVQIDATAFDDSSSNSYVGITDETTWTFTTADTPTCPAIDNTATYNAWPTCGVATCNTGYTLSGGACVSSGGSAAAPPPAVGSGEATASVGMGQVSQIISVTSQGVNVLSYITSQTNFNTIVSTTMSSQSHSFQISNLDLHGNVVTLIFQSEPTTIYLALGETKKIDLDKDGINDIEATFTDLIINRVEITTRNLLEDNNNEGKLIKYSNSPKIYLIQNNQKRWIVSEEVFNYYGYKWNKIITIKDSIAFEDGEDITQGVEKIGYIFIRDLEFGTKGDDIKELQKYLNNNGFMLTENGPGSKGNETDLFGYLTRSALAKFQLANKIKPAVGYFGPITRGFINK